MKNKDDQLYISASRGHNGPSMQSLRIFRNYKFKKLMVLPDNRAAKLATSTESTTAGPASFLATCAEVTKIPSPAQLPMPKNRIK